MKRITNHIRLLAPAFCLLALPLVARAAGTTGLYGLYDPMAGASIPQIIGNIIKLLMGIVGAVFLVMFLWGGFVWLTAGGTPKKVETAKKILQDAILGVAAVVASFTILSLIIKFATLIQS